MVTSRGLQLIARERARQITEEEWTDAHDDGQTEGELARAAAVYALPPDAREITKGFRIRDSRVDVRMSLVDAIWPWLRGWWKPGAPSIEGRLRDLSKAGALIAAEIDRILRQADASSTVVAWEGEAPGTIVGWDLAAPDGVSDGEGGVVTNGSTSSADPTSLVALWQERAAAWKDRAEEAERRAATAEGIIKDRAAKAADTPPDEAEGQQIVRSWRTSYLTEAVANVELRAALWELRALQKATEEHARVQAERIDELRAALRDAHFIATRPTEGFRRRTQETRLPQALNALKRIEEIAGEALRKLWPVPNLPPRSTEP